MVKIKGVHDGRKVGELSDVSRQTETTWLVKNGQMIIGFDPGLKTRDPWFTVKKLESCSHRNLKNSITSHERFSSWVFTNKQIKIRKMIR